MPRNAAGLYTLPASNPVIPLTIITSQWANETMSDVAAALTQSIAANGTTVPTTDLPMGGYKHTGVAKALQYNQYARADQVQQAEFIVVKNITANAGATIYSGTLPFGAGNATTLVDKQPAIFTAPVTNGVAPQLALNGGSAYPIVNPEGTPVAANKFVPNQPMALIWNTIYTAWVLVGSTGASITSVTSADVQMLTVTNPTTANALLTPISNVANGMVKLTPAGKVPTNLLPAGGGTTMLGVWSAIAGTLPPNGTASGQFYLISNPGNLNLYTWNGTAYTTSVVPVVAGDQILWNQTAPEPTGWYRLQTAAAVIATNVSNTATPNYPGVVNLQAWINVADSTTGFALLNGNRPFTGNVYGLSYTAPTHAGNLYYSSGWKFYAATGWGFVHNNDPAWPLVTYVSNAASTGANSVATVVDLAYWRLDASYIRSPWGVGGQPRNVGGIQQYHLDIQGIGSQRFAVNSSDSQVGCKIVAAATGVFFDAIRMGVDGGAPIPASSPGIPFNIRLSDTTGVTFTAATFNPNTQMQVGDGVKGSIASTQAVNLGVYSGALSLVTAQTIPISPGSNITGLTMTKGQIGRIQVLGSGSITLPATIKLPRGGALYGTSSTIIGFYYDGTTIYASFTPYD
jgi:hypothetical protein